MPVINYPQTNLFPYTAMLGNAASAAVGAAGVETTTRFGLAEFAGVSGQLWVSYFTPVVDSTITKLMMASAGTAGAGQTLDRMALFTVAGDDSLTKVAQTASDTTIGLATYTPYERSLSTVGGFPASYSLVAGTRYALGFLETATTPTKLQGMFIVDSGTPPIASRIITGQTDIAASYAVASLSSTFTIVYLRGRP